jgi:hypothetical protein
VEVMRRTSTLRIHPPPFTSRERVYKDRQVDLRIALRPRPTYIAFSLEPPQAW